MTSTDANKKLEELIAYGTPEAIKKQYQTLASEAKTRSFGLLEEDLVILDTETTGLSFKDDSLIEIAAVRISGREVIDTFQTFVHPPKPIPAEITELTAISNADVTNAPKPEEAIAALTEFVSGSPIVAHNATFDKTFVEKVPGGSSVSDVWIDSLALSRIALPRLKSHALSVMAEAFDLMGVSHRAMDDVEALVGLWRVLLVALSKLEPGLLSTFAHMHKEVTWPYRFIFSHLHAEVSGTQDTSSKTPFSFQRAREQILNADAAEPKKGMRSKESELVKVDKEETRRAFAAGGTVSLLYDEFEPRQEQIEMSDAVLHALNDQEFLALEAGTGVGKSIGYLLPLSLYAQRNNVTCGVATKSIALTDQLVQKELPALSDALTRTHPHQFPEGLRFASLKGYEHYPCLRRVERGLTAALPLEFVENSINIAAVDQLNALAVIMTNACQAPEGDLDGLGIRWRNVPREFVSCSAEECERKACPYFLSGCPLHGARRRAAAADIVITNHALLLRDIASEGNILPPISQWVIDESHSFADEARRQWAREASAATLRSVFEHLGGLRTGFIHALLVQLKGAEADAPIKGLLTKAAREVQPAIIASSDFFDHVANLLQASDKSAYSEVNLWLGPELRETKAWKGIAEIGETLHAHLETLIKTLGEADKMLSETLEHPAAGLGDSVRVLREQRDALALVLAGDSTDYAYSLRGKTGKGQRGAEKLIALPVDVAQALVDDFYAKELSVIYCSATIALGESFAHFDREVGLDLLPPEMVRHVLLSSPFDLENQMAVLFTNDMPAHTDGGYHEKLARLLFDIHVAMDGSVLTLFTNRRDMEATYRILEPMLSAQGLELQQQSQREAAWRIQKRFVANKKMSLFALKSFWEGIDARGETLRCVVIPKIAFANPNDPLVQERREHDPNSWRKYCLPEAQLHVKQAAGRLIRSASDTGILIISDARIFTKQYGKQFRTSVPCTAQHDLSCDAIGDFITTWRSSHEAQ